MPVKLTREQLIELVDKIIRMKGTDEEIDQWLEQVCANVPHPGVSDLIFYSEKQRTPEEIVDEALRYERRVFNMPPSTESKD